MVAYICIGIMFLYVIVKSAVSFNRPKHAPTMDDIDKRLLSIMNREGEQS